MFLSVAICSNWFWRLYKNLNSLFKVNTKNTIIALLVLFWCFYSWYGAGLIVCWRVCIIDFWHVFYHLNIFQTIRDDIEDGGKPQHVNLTRRAMKDPTGMKAYTKKGTYPGEWVLNIFKLWSFTLRYTLFLRAILFSTHTQCCLTFSWIVI